MNPFHVHRVAKFTFDATSGKVIAAHPLNDAVIPSGAIITNAYYNVRTTFTSSSDAATIALKIAGTGDLKAAIAISDASNVWDAGLHGCLPGSYAERTVAGDTAILDAASKSASYILTTSSAPPVLTVAVEDLTAGVLDLYIEYVI